MTKARTLVLGILLFAPGGVALCGAEPGKRDGPVSYYKDVRPLFVQHCQGCHQPAKAGGGYVMTSAADLLKAGDTGEAGVLPGQPQKSLLVAQITAKDG